MRYRSFRMIMAAVCTAALLPTLARAATIVVDADGTYDAATLDCTGADPAMTTIQSAGHRRSDGDTISVCPGTYAEAQITI